jgi:two-component system, OmpR family, phosphate regulon response regulator PhoB
VLLLTARAQERDRRAGDEAGADAYLVKPFSPIQLARTVAELLKVQDESGTA